MKKVFLRSLIITLIIQLSGFFAYTPSLTDFFQADITHAQSPSSAIYTVYRDAVGGENITTTAQSLSWDTQISENIEIPTDGTNTSFDLSAGGHYLVMYSVPVRSTGGSNRSEAQSWLRINGTTDSPYSYASSYIRRVDGDSDGYNEAAAVIDVNAGDDIDIRIQKTDSNTATFERTPNRSGINILKLDDTWDYARLRPSLGQAITTTWEEVDLGISDELDTSGYSISGNDVTLSQAGKYLVTYNVGTITTGTDRTNNEMRLTLDGTEIDATRSTAYTRAQNGSFVGISSYVGIIEASSIGQVLNLEVRRESTLQGDTNGIIQNKTGITITRLPDSADYVRVGEVTGGQDMTTTADTPITFDTTFEEDVNSFDHDNVNREQINIAQDGNYLFFHNIYNTRTDTSNGPRQAPFLEWEHNGVGLQYGTSGSYNRIANDGDGISNSSSSSAGIIVPNMLLGDTIELVETNEAALGSAVYEDEKMGIQGVNLESLFIPRAIISQTHFRFRDDSADLDASSGWLAAEDVEITNIERNQTYRVRISVANEGQLSESNDKQFRLEWGDAQSGTCASILPSAWNEFSTPNDPWAASETTHISPNGEVSPITLLANNEGYNFLDTHGYELGNLETSFVLGSSIDSFDYKEYEFSMTATDYAVNGHRYCFRLYDIENNTELESYNYASAIIDATAIANIADWGEAGSITAPANGGWTTLNFSGEGYVDPVVVGRTNTHNDPNEALVFESRNITSTSAQVRLCDSSAGNATGCQNHLAETIGYIVVDADKTHLINGIEAGTFVENTSIDTAGGLTVTLYDEVFTSTPYVFTSIQSTDGDSPIVTRVTSSDMESFTAGICQQNSTDGCNASHPNETVGWIAIDPGFNAFGNERQIGTGISTSPSDVWTPVTFSTAFSSTPVVISQTVTNLGGQDAQIDEVQGVTTTGMEFRSCELDNDDDCDAHAIDTVRWMAVQEGVFSQIVVGTYNFDMTNYRWYDNADSVTPGSALANENTQLTNLPGDGEIRLRTLIQNGLMELTPGIASYGLQYASGSTCESLTTWIDVGNPGGGEDWLMFDNPTPVSGSVIGSSLLFGGGHVVETYNESLPAATNPNTVPIGQWGEWDFSLFANNVAADSQYCFRITGRNQPIHQTVFAQVNLQDSNDPIISTFTPGSGALLPIGNFDITYTYEDTESGIDTSSVALVLQKWDGSIWGTNIAGGFASLDAITITGASYDITGLDFGRYRAIFQISDNAGNSSTLFHEFFVDEIEFTISDSMIDVGNIDMSSTLFMSSDILTVTVKTVGVGFHVDMLQQADLDNNGGIIPDWDGSMGFGYDESPFVSANAFASGNTVLTQARDIHPDGEKYTYSVDLQYAVLLDILENHSAGNYESLLDFNIVLDYN